MPHSWKESVLKYLGLDVDVSLLESIDFLIEQILLLQKFIERNKLQLKFTNEDRRKLAGLAVTLDPKKRDMYSLLVECPTWKIVKLFSKFCRVDNGVLSVVCRCAFLSALISSIPENIATIHSLLP